MGCTFSWLYSASARIDAFGASLEVVSTLGEGAFSTVFLVRSAIAIKGQQPGMYALKQMMVPRDNLHLIERETRAHERVAGHPHVLELIAHELRSTGNSDVMEALLLFPLCNGGTLAAALEKAAETGGFTEAQAFEIVAQLSAAVAHCHAKNVTHRDIKLTNVYLNVGKWVLADFGSSLLSADAAVLGARDELALARHEVETLTTPEYRAPEQVSLELGSVLGPEVDAWAVGVALHQVAYSCNPFATPLATLSDRQPCEAEARASPRLRSLVSALLARSPAERCTAAQAHARCVAALAEPASAVPAANEDARVPTFEANFD